MSPSLPHRRWGGAISAVQVFCAAKPWNRRNSFPTDQVKYGVPAKALLLWGGRCDRDLPDGADRGLKRKNRAGIAPVLFFHNKWCYPLRSAGRSPATSFLSRKKQRVGGSLPGDLLSARAESRQRPKAEPLNRIRRYSGEAEWCVLRTLRWGDFSIVRKVTKSTHRG